MYYSQYKEQLKRRGIYGCDTRFVFLIVIFLFFFYIKPDFFKDLGAWTCR